MNIVPAARVAARSEGGSGRLARYRYEAVLTGIWAPVAPPIVLVSFTGIGFLAAAPGRLLTGAIVCGVPVVAGLVAASMLASEPALELQLASRDGWRPAALRRLALLVAWCAVLSLAAVVVGRASGLFDEWPGKTSLAADVSMALAPLAGFAVWGCLLGVAMRSRGAAAAAITSFWLAGLAWKDLFLAESPLRAWFPFMYLFDPQGADALQSQVVLLGIAGLGLAILAAWLGRSEWLLGAEDR